MKQAQASSSDVPAADIIAAAEQLLVKVQEREVPDFIRQRLAQLDKLISMLKDDDWSLPEAEAKRVVDALCYFSDEDDLIPDDIPGVGFLDDAIMVELVVNELQHELSAYQDFCNFRNTDASEGVTRSDWLKARRSELQSRMRSKRSSDKRRGRGPLGLF